MAAEVIRTNTEIMQISKNFMPSTNKVSVIIWSYTDVQFALKK